jgi:hypothetical protein
VDTWAAHHVYGIDDLGRAFSTAANEGDVEHRDVTWGNNYVRVASPSMQRYPEPFESCVDNTSCIPTEVTGDVTFTHTFTSLVNGIRVNHKIDYEGADEIKELWISVPVFLRDTDQASINDTTIEYWNGVSWAGLTTTAVIGSKIRLGRNFGAGAQYGYITLDSPRAIKLSSAVWVQAYQGNSRHRNILIDLHGKPGTAVTFPSAVDATFSVTTQETVGPVWEGPVGEPIPAPTFLRLQD